MVRMGRWNGVLAAALALLLNGWPAALRAQDDPAKAQLESLNQQAIQFYQQGEYQNATELFEQVVKLADKTFGPDHPDLATYMDNLGQLYRAGPVCGGRAAPPTQPQDPGSEARARPPRCRHRPEQPCKPVPITEPVRGGRATL